MDKPVMTPADEHQIPDCGHSAIGPVLDVVGVAPRGRTVTPREAAVPVSHDQGAPHRGRHDRSATAYVERLGTATGDDSADRGVACPPADDLGVDRAYVVELAAVTCASFERL